MDNLQFVTILDERSSIGCTVRKDAIIGAANDEAIKFQIKIGGPLPLPLFFLPPISRPNKYPGFMIVNPMIGRKKLFFMRPRGLKKIKARVCGGKKELWPKSTFYSRPTGGEGGRAPLGRTGVFFP